MLRGGDGLIGCVKNVLGSIKTMQEAVQTIDVKQPVSEALQKYLRFYFFNVLPKLT